MSPLCGIGRSHVFVNGDESRVHCLESGRRFVVRYPAHLHEYGWEDGKIVDRDLDRLPPSPLSDEEILRSAHIARLDAYRMF